MKKIILFSVLLTFLVLSCSEKKEPTETDVKTHPDGWVQSHGTAILENQFSEESCTSCHGEKFEGGNSGVACMECHYYPHLPPWTDPKSSSFHGKIASEKGLGECQDCHGENFRRDATVTSCYDCHTYPHLDPWMDVSSERFHGQIVQQLGKEECQACHGTDFQGGSSGVACENCHTYPHPDFFKGGTVHGEFIKTELNWNLLNCRVCHGTSYTGGRVTIGLACTDCHTGEEGPEACNTCHGDFGNPQQIAPPQDLSNNFNMDAVGVGAHQAHVTTTEVTNSYDCEVCHTPVTQFASATHIDETPLSEIEFAALATGNGTLNTSWSHENASCGEVYCHGAFVFNQAESANPWGYADSLITGNAGPVSWTQPISQANICSACHGLPPTGHINNNITTINDCADCHSSVVNAQGEIIDKSKHINGEADL